MVTNNKIKISSRSLLDLLSGRISSEKLLEANKWFSLNRDNQASTNFFEMRLKEGRLFTNISIEKEINYDDDMIVFEFGDPDPAIVPFKHKNKANVN